MYGLLYRCTPLSGDFHYRDYVIFYLYYYILFVLTHNNGGYMQLVKGKPGFQPKQYIPEGDANALGRLMGQNDQQKNLVSTVLLGHFAALPAEEGIMVGSVIAEGVVAKTSGTYETTAWNVLPPGAAANATPVLVKDIGTFNKLMDSGYQFHSETVAITKVGMQ